MLLGLAKALAAITDANFAEPTGRPEEMETPTIAVLGQVVIGGYGQARHSLAVLLHQNDVPIMVLGRTRNTWIKAEGRAAVLLQGYWSRTPDRREPMDTRLGAVRPAGG